MGAILESGGETMAPPSGKTTFNRAVGAVLGAAVLLAGGYALGRHTGISARSSALQNKEERLSIVPSFPACSKAGENCYSTGCCQVSGHKCYTKSFGVALGKSPRGRQMATGRLRSEGGRRRCLRASALARVARQQGRRHPSRRLLRELPQRAVRTLRQSGGD